MSANDGGDPIRLSKAPVEKPVIPRGRTLVASELCDDDVAIGGAVTFSWKRKDAHLTFHDAPIVGFAGNDVIVMVEAETVVTWEALDSSESQI